MHSYVMPVGKSYVVDVQNKEVMGGLRDVFEKAGFKVKVFDPENPEESDHYNPFKYLRSDKDILSLADMLVSDNKATEGGTNDSFWVQSEKALLTAVIALVFHNFDETYKSFSNIMRMLRMADVDENSSDAESRLDMLFNSVEDKDPDSFAVKQYKVFNMGAGTTKRDVFVSTAVRLQMFDTEEVAKLTDDDTLELDRFYDEPHALFIVSDKEGELSNLLKKALACQISELAGDKK